jgi:translation initiation factor 2 subunit 3
MTEIINVGCIGSVGNGKSELIYALSNVRTQRDSREKKRNITIKAGYANVKLWNCFECNIKYSTAENVNEHICSNCSKNNNLIKHISFLDIAGHESLFESMINSISSMSFAIVIISVDEPISKKPQLKQHLLAAKVNNLNKLIVCLNKCDLVSIQTAGERKQELDEFLASLDIVPCAVIPTSFTNKLGLNYLIDAIDLYFNCETEKNNNQDTLFRITRSFDINFQNIDYTELKGGCIGGSLVSGNLNIGDKVYIIPGILTKQKDLTFTYEVLETTILGFQCDKIPIDNIQHGGLVAILTDIDPYYTKDDSLKNNILTTTLVDIHYNLKISYNKIDESYSPKNNDSIFLQIDNMLSEGKINKIKNNLLDIQLFKPIYVSENSNILLCIKKPTLKIIGIGKLISH